MAFVASGVPRDIGGGIFVGGTDMRELTPGPGLPAGLTIYTGVAGNIEALDEGGTEGVVIRQNDTSGQFFGWGIDAFDGLWTDGSEMLMRSYVNSVAGSGSRNKFGLGVWDDVSFPGDIDDWEGVLSNAFGNTLRWRGYSGLGGSGVPVPQSPELNEGDPPGGFAPFYSWMRLRLTDAGAGLTNIKAHFTFGLDADVAPPQPGVWDIDQSSLLVMPQITGATSKMGFLRAAFGPHQLSDRRWSYFSFSNDPINSPPPTPGEILPPGAQFAPPTVAVNPIQDTWVGLIGSPLEAL